MFDASTRPFCSPDTPPQWTRPRQFRIVHVDLAVTIDLDAERITGEVTHQVDWLPHGGERRTLELDQHELAISAVEIGGSPASFSITAGRVVIALPEGIGASFAARVSFTADHPAKGMYFIRPDVAAGRVAMAWTQGAMEDHSHWFPCFDSPNNLSTYRVAIRHRAELLAAANGERMSRVEHGDGWATSVFAQRQLHVLYLLNVVVGDLVAVDQPGAPVPVTHYLPRGHEAKALDMFRATGFALAWLGDFIGVPFAWKRYGHVVVHGFMWGGMENTTLTTITDRGLMDHEVQAREDVEIDSLVIHELVHQWYGDLLTMKAWSDIWLNESFATYLEARATAAWRASRGDGSNANLLALELWTNRQAYLDEDGGRYRRPLVTNRYVDAYELFDRVAYEKGSLVLHSLCQHLGEERFRAALALYTTRHAHDLVETADFRQALEDATGEPLDWFFEQWVQRAGHPRLKVVWRHDPARGQLIVDIEQTQAAGDAQQTFRLRTALAWGRPNAQVTRECVELTRARETLVFACAQAPRWLALDPDGDLLAEWEEDGEIEELLARLADAGLGAQGRARAAVVAGTRHPAPRLVAGLAAVLADPATPELVCNEIIAALGRMRVPATRDVLLAAWSRTPAPRLRRALAKALAQFKHDATLAAKLMELAEGEPSLLTAGELYAARGAIEHPGATPLLRAQLKRPSWNQRLRQAVLRGLGDCGEPAAIDEVLGVLANPDEIDGVRIAACAAAANLGSRFQPAQGRVRRALVAQLDAPSLLLRSAAAKALGQLGDPAALPALTERSTREIFGNVRRVLREAQEKLGKAAATSVATAELTRRLDETEKAKRSLELRVEAIEKRLGESTAGISAPKNPRTKGRRTRRK